MLYNDICKILNKNERYFSGQTMKKEICIHLILGILQILVGIFGSCFAFVVSGCLMLFKGIQSASSTSKKPIKAMVCIVFAIICVYLIYYSFFMFVSELDYATVRPETWVAIPLAITFIVLIAMMMFAREDLYSDEITDISALSSLLKLEILDMTIFAIIFVGWLGTFLFDFYFDYAASACVAVCLVKHIKDYLLPTTTKQTNTTLVSEEISSEPETNS